MEAGDRTMTQDHDDIRDDTFVPSWGDADAPGLGARWRRVVSERFGRLKEMVTEQGRVLPANDATSRPLLAVIALMCYLAALAGEGVLVVNRAATEWTHGLSSSLTVQIYPTAGDTPQSLQAQVDRARDLLKDSAGVVSAEAISPGQANKLLEPWLGAGMVLDELPVPRLIDVRIDGRQPPDLEALRRTLAALVPTAHITDHGRWNTRISAFATFLRALAAGILLLTIATTVAIVVFATRAGLAARQDIVEVLHLIGARDTFIAREFQAQFLSLGLRAGIAGMAGAAATVLLVRSFSSRLADSAGLYLVPHLDLRLGDLFLLAVIPCGAILVAMLTARLTVLRAIGKAL